MDQTTVREPMTFTDVLRKRFKYILDPLATFLNRSGLHPNTVTIIGLLGNCVAAVFLATGNFTVGGLIMLIAIPIDALDGTMARLRGEASNFGAFVDSVSDRYAELIIFGGMLIHFLSVQNLVGALLVYLAASGSVLVSYVRARAQSVGFEAKIGLFSRVERFIVLIPCLVFNIPMVAVWILAILTNFTALQRVQHVRSTAWAQMKEKKKSG